MKKRIIALVLSGFMVLSMAACGSQESGDPKEAEQST